MSSQPPSINTAVARQLEKILNGEPSTQSLASAYRLLAKWRSQLVSNTIKAKDGTTVQGGPFKGMNYAVAASEGAHAARLLGCYEASIAPVIETIVTSAYPVVIDVGSAEGYYAVGLARRMAGTRVLARDTNPVAQQRCAELARINQVEKQVEVGGPWNHADFDLCTSTRCAVICDIEGGEDALLDPDKATGLRHADILVEVHEGIVPGLTQRMADRFAKTHKITRFGRTVDMQALPDWMETLSDLDRMTALWEWRGAPTPWLWMQAHDHP